MTLAEATKGATVEVESVGRKLVNRRRLLELGMVPGTLVRLEHAAPFGDPLGVAVRGMSVSIAREDAQAIVVRPCLKSC